MYVTVIALKENGGRWYHDVKGEGPIECPLPPEWTEVTMMANEPVLVRCVFSSGPGGAAVRLDSKTTIQRSSPVAVALLFEKIPEEKPSLTPVMERTSRWLEAGHPRWEEDQQIGPKLVRAILDRMSGPDLEAALAEGWKKFDDDED